MLFSKTPASRARLLPLLILMASLAACQTTNKEEALIPTVEERVLAGDIKAKNFFATRPTAQVTAFKAGDVVDIEVFNEPSLSGAYPVDNSGRATFPYIGAVNVAGKNAIDVQEDINQRYANGFFQKPNVVVKQLEEAEVGYVVVDGQVANPGLVDLDEATHLSEVIAKVGGISEEGDPKSVYVLREGGGEKELYRINLSDVRLAQATDPILIPSDVIIVKKEDEKLDYDDVLRTIPLLNFAVLAATRF